MYHLIALLIGFFVDLLLGDPHSIPHPVVWIGKLISAAEKLVRRLFPKTVRGENIAGGVLWVLSCSSRPPFRRCFCTRPTVSIRRRDSSSRASCAGRSSRPGRCATRA